MKKLKTILKVIYVGLAVQVLLIILSATIQSLYFKQFDIAVKQQSVKNYSFFIDYFHTLINGDYVSNALIMSYFLFLLASIVGLVFAIYKNYIGYKEFKPMIVKYIIAFVASSTLYFIVLNLCIFLLF